MGSTIQNIPFFCVLWIGIGFIFIIAGVFVMASRAEANNHYIEFADQKPNTDYPKQVGELFSYFLEEEEKKNQGLREMLLEGIDKKSEVQPGSTESHLSKDSSPQNPYSPKPRNHSHSDLNEIIQLHEQGFKSEEIAKKIKKGVGEVNLMISLYTMDKI
ncbi:MAG: hypothetical protein K0S30_628 [Clostridia bacterium]|jgi:hypothetical protein|nr:hypothetical protein [Clostridia bacterium]